MELPVVCPPSAYGYQFYAFPLAIVETIPASEGWLLSNHVQLAYDPAPESPVPLCFYLYDYADNPWLETVRLSQDWLAAVQPDIVEFVRLQVGMGYYVYLNVDEFHIERREDYNLQHWSHDVLVHGMDDDRGTLSILGYDEKGRFCSAEIRQDSFRRAHASHREMDADCQQVHCYRPRPDAHFPLDRSLIRRSLVEYLEGANTSEHFAMLRTPWPRSYGVDVYEPLQELTEAYAAGYGRGDLRHLHVLWEHKRLMTRRIRALASTDGTRALADEAERLERWAYSLRIGMLRHERRPEGSGFPDAARRIRELRNADVALVERLLDAPELTEGTFREP